MKFKFFKIGVINLLLFILIFSSFLLGIYSLTYLLTSFFLIYIFIKSKSFNTKIITVFYLMYYIIPLPNISSYRGTISYHTLVLYTSMILLSYLPLFLFNNNFTLYKYKKIQLTRFFHEAVILHLFVVYVLLFYVYTKYGLIFIYQELRFGIPPILSYVIKSSIYIPLFFHFNNNKSLKTIFIYIILPILPAIFMGSRGAVILIIFGLIILMFLTYKSKDNNYLTNYLDVWKNKKMTIIYSSFFSVIVLYIFSYSRRIFSDKLISNLEMIKQYFNNSYLYLLILPLYTSLRETIGISNKIINDEIRNDVLSYPMFFSELYTLLPGEQLAPGKVLGDLIGRKLGGGLTPGILGGLYLDYQEWSIISCLIIVIFIRYFFIKSINSDFYKIIYSLSLIQFFHLFHRGFLKPEYLESYVIIIFYFIIIKIRYSTIR